MSRRRPPRKQKAKAAKKEEPEEDEIANLQSNNYDEDDKFFEKWAGPVLLGPFLPAIFSLFIIVAGQMVLSTFTGVCGYDLQCK